LGRGGSSLCGISVISAAKGASKADDDDATFAILALGAFELFVAPLIGHLYGMSDKAFWAAFACSHASRR